MTKNRVFISCSHKDREIVETIAGVLEKNNYEVIKNYDYNYDNIKCDIDYNTVIYKNRNIKEKFK